jgi:hypothetical protein
VTSEIVFICRVILTGFVAKVDGLTLVTVFLCLQRANMQQGSSIRRVTSISCRDQMISSTSLLTDLALVYIFLKSADDQAALKR